MEKLLLKASEVGTILSLGRSKVYQLIASKTIPKIDGSIRISAVQLKEWVEKEITAQAKSKKQ